MIITIDTETQGLGGKYITGSICQNGKTTSYPTIEKINERINQLSETEKKRKRKLTIYAHNINYDFYTIWNKKTNEYEWKSHRPTIINKKDSNITYLGTEALYPRMTLEKIGETINQPKTHPNTELWKKITSDKEQTYTFEEINQLKQYCENDALIAYKAITHIQEKLKKEKIKPKRIISIAQLALCKYNQIIRNDNELKRNMTYYNKKGEYTLNYIKPISVNYHYKAAREKRFQAFKLGEYNNVTEVDINSLYPYASTLIKFPNLSTEKINNQPKKTEYNKLLTKVGISECIIQKKEEKIGTIPIRWQNETIYPNQKCTMIGTWTNQELEWYISKGHKIKYIKQINTYETQEKNPLKEYMEHFYQKRKQNPNDQLFYKNMMNSLIGKLAQREKHEDYEAIQNYEVEYKLTKGYKPYQPIGNNATLMGNPNQKKLANHYQGIISYQVWAKAREILYEKGLNQIPVEDLLYCNTDNVVFTGNHLNKFILDNEMGNFKIGKDHEGNINQNRTCTIYGKGDLRLGKDIRLGGITKTKLTKEDFEKGIVQNQKQITIKTTRDINDIGKFETKTIDLNPKRQNEEDKRQIINQTELFIDDYEKYDTIEHYQKEGYI